MKCSGCGKELKPDTISCPNCGRLITIHTRFSSKSSTPYTGVIQQQGRVMTDHDYDEETKIVTERKEKISSDTSTQQKVNQKTFRIVDDSAAIDSTGITFNITSGKIPVGNLALSFDEPEEGISATAMNPDTAISTDNRKYLIFLEVWEEAVTSIDDSDLISVDVEGPSTSSQYNVGFRWLPATDKTIANPDLVDTIESQKKDHQKRHLVPLAVLDATKKGPISVTHFTHEFSDLLKPRSTINIESLGSKMDGSHYVASIRHEILPSDEAENSERIECGFCGAVNDRNDKFCQNCGAAIVS
jgi:hypothetical protein